MGDLLDTWGLAPEELEALGLVVEGPGDHSTGGKEALSLAAAGKKLAADRLVKVRHLDLDGDGIRERYSLRDGILRVEVGSRQIWETPACWWVDYFFLGDANNDGRPELDLLLGRRAASAHSGHSVEGGPG